MPRMPRQQPGHRHHGALPPLLAKPSLPLVEAMLSLRKEMLMPRMPQSHRHRTPSYIRQKVDTSYDPIETQGLIHFFDDDAQESITDLRKQVKDLKAHLQALQARQNLAEQRQHQRHLQHLEHQQQQLCNALQEQNMVLAGVRSLMSECSVRTQRIQLLVCC